MMCKAIVLQGLQGIKKEVFIFADDANFSKR